MAKVTCISMHTGGSGAIHPPLPPGCGQSHMCTYACGGGGGMSSPEEDSSRSRNIEITSFLSHSAVYILLVSTVNVDRPQQ